MKEGRVNLGFSFAPRLTSVSYVLSYSTVFLFSFNYS